MEEKIAQQIAEKLIKTCPAFDYDHNCGPAIWHKCKCKAQDNSPCFSPCTCVWHVTNKCIAGTWSPLSFLEKYYQDKQKKANEYLFLAKEAAAITKAEKGA